MQVQLVPQHLVPQPPVPLQQQQPVTVTVTVQPVQPVPLPLTHTQAKLKWLLEQVHMVRSRSVNTHPWIADRNSVAGLFAAMWAQQGGEREASQDVH